jgi:hypothetical protein|uniref:Uncharacterized protein n=1 Tax=Eutreptiella gymnastica TaxID=73025 RepID=A0A7S4D0K3_9EUGL|mmetsp:Transcript_9872/g.16659  ORF Transcript_9872/g.16659 Transcript_9872/m.16659 type:complete len:146 (-) Transcript_9872:11-448(-)
MVYLSNHPFMLAQTNVALLSYLPHGYRGAQPTVVDTSLRGQGATLGSNVWECQQAHSNFNRLQGAHLGKHAAVSSGSNAKVQGLEPEPKGGRNPPPSRLPSVVLNTSKDTKRSILKAVTHVTWISCGGCSYCSVVRPVSSALSFL